MSQPQMYVVSDIADVFLPSPTDLLVNIKECEEIIFQLLDKLPQLFQNTKNSQSALGPALQAAFKLMVRNTARVSAHSGPCTASAQHCCQISSTTMGSYLLLAASIHLFCV